jgi:N-acetylglucosamine-6-sulfatase
MDLLGTKQVEGIDELYRGRLQTMLAIDEMMKRLVESLRYSGKLKNTYIFFTSDHGWTMGEHRRRAGKLSAYEEDIRVPLIVSGPGVPQGTVREHMVLNNDLAPTFAELGSVSAPSFVDGRSFVPLLHPGPPSPANWRSAFLEEAVKAPQGPIDRPAFKAVRTSNHLWVEYVNGERELYNLREDPYELQSVHQTAPLALKQRLSSKLDRLRECSRQGCRNAEGF